MRISGLLLHITSLPDSPGLGDLGPTTERFLRSLPAAEQSLWQVLPLGPTGYGDSPYQSPSTFAGNPLLVSPERLVEWGLIDGFAAAPESDPTRVDFGAVIPWKWEILRHAAAGRRAGRGPSGLRAAFDAFRKREADWLADYGLFAAIHDERGEAWFDWPDPLKLRDPKALKAERKRLAAEIEVQEFAQFLFFRQWDEVRALARELHVEILGDIPLFVAHDSADVWADPELFLLDENSDPIRVAGAPPDVFTDDGQLWGNPLYRWDILEATDFAWWKRRVRRALDLYDRVRLDHFRGFCANWAVPVGEETARHGAWEEVPGAKLFAALRADLGELPFVAEDLGEITDDVHELREALGFPGMKILQFAFGGTPRDNEFAPFNIERNAVVYPGTHDTETIRGWFEDGLWNSMNRPREEAERERLNVCVATGSYGDDMAWAMCRTAMMTVADLAILPMQDLLNLGNEARMNLPGRFGENWVWRLTRGAWNDDVIRPLRELTVASGRDGTSLRAAAETATAAATDSGAGATGATA